MKPVIFSFAFIALSGCSTSSTIDVDTSSATAITSYSTGYEAGLSVNNGLKNQRLDQNLFLIGVEDAINGHPSRHKLSPEDVAKALEEHTEWLTITNDEETRIASNKNAEEGSIFRSSYASRQDTQRLDDEILYTVLTSGNGTIQPSAEDTVEVHYEGRFPDGTVFDSSIKRGTPVAVDLNTVISGWRKVLTQMKEGDEWEVVLPPTTAYGTNGRAPLVGPNQTLIFKIELISII